MFDRRIICSLLPGTFWN